MMTDDTITALKPTPEPFEPTWSRTALAEILAETQGSDAVSAPWWRSSRRRTITLVATGALALTTGAAVAVGGPTQVVKDAIESFSHQPSTTGNGLGVLEDPALVAQFRTERGIFAAWIATSSSGKVCFASSDGAWDGEGSPTRSELEYGCGGTIVTNDGTLESLTRPEQLGGFFKDDAGPLLYGVSPYPDAVTAHVQGKGVDRTLPVRSDSHGYGAALPEASGADAVTVTFLDGAGRELGSTRWVAPVG